MRGIRIVQLNRRTGITLDDSGVIKKFGVSPESIPDYLACGRPPTVIPDFRLGREVVRGGAGLFVHLESIPSDVREWCVNAANASTLAATFSRERERALLFRTLATLRTDVVLFEDVNQLHWKGPTANFEALAARWDAARTESRRPGAQRSRRTS